MTSTVLRFDCDWDRAARCGAHSESSKHLPELGGHEPEVHSSADEQASPTTS